MDGRVMEDRKGQQFEDLPENVITFLTDFDTFMFVREFLSKNGIQNVPEALVLELVNDYIFQRRDFHSLQKDLEMDVGISPDVSLQAAVDFASHLLLPITGIIGNVPGFIEELGGNVDPDGVKIVMPSVSAEDFVNGFLLEHDVEMQSPNLQHRLVLAVVAYAKGEKTTEELKSFLTRDVKVGGVEMSKEEAERLMAAIAQTLETMKLRFFEKEFKAAPEPPASAKPRPVSPPSDPAIKKEESVKPLVLAPEPEEKNVAEPVLQTMETQEPKAEPIPAPAPKKPAVVASKPVEAPAEKIVLAPEPVRKEPVSSAVPAKPMVFPKPIPAPAFIQPTPDPKPAGTVGAKIVSDQFNEEDAKEIADIETKTKPFRDTSEPLVDFDEAKSRIYEAVGLSFTDVEMKKRFDLAVDSRLRGIRDAYETRNQLESAPEQGGIGLTGSALADASQKIEEIVGQYQSDVAKKLQEEKRARLHQLKQEREARETTLKGKESDLLSKRFAQITGVAPGQSVRPAAPTGARTSGTSSAEEQLKRQEQQVDTDRVRQALQTSTNVPSAVTPMYSPGTLHENGRPNMQDVRFVRKLAGPTEELRTMDLSDFRRLSRSPEEAAKKVLDKIDLLAQDGFEKKVEGIKAWRESPMNQLYLELTREAFVAGKSIEDILEAREAAGNASLTRNDINAIMELNAQLRF